MYVCRFFPLGLLNLCTGLRYERARAHERERGLHTIFYSRSLFHKMLIRWQIPDCGLLCDLLWSDPDKDITGWSENDRGVSFTFGPDVVSRFLQKHDMDLICRAHQVVEDGYEFFSKRQLVTLFSAPNYCGEFDNAGAMMSVDESLLCSFQVRKALFTLIDPSLANRSVWFFFYGLLKYEFS